MFIASAANSTKVKIKSLFTTNNSHRANLAIHNRYGTVRTQGIFGRYTFAAQLKDERIFFLLVPEATVPLGIKVGDLWNFRACSQRYDLGISYLGKGRQQQWQQGEVSEMFQKD